MPVPISSRASSPAALRQHDPIQTHPDNSFSPYKINPHEKHSVNRNRSQTVGQVYRCSHHPRLLEATALRFVDLGGLRFGGRIHGGGTSVNGAIIAPRF